MPRGNDADAAGQEMAEKFGAPTNAAQMIDSQRNALDRRVLRASQSPIDEGATKALNLDDLKVNRGETVVGASVRGNYVIAVVEDEDGNVLPKRLFDVPKAAMEESTAADPVPGGGPKLRTPDVEPAGDEAMKEAAERRKFMAKAEEQRAKEAAEQAEAAAKAAEAAAVEPEPEAEAESAPEDDKQAAAQSRSSSSKK